MFSRKILHHLLIPGGLLLPTAVFLQFWPRHPKILETVLEFLPYAVVILGAFLGWRFNRSRLVLAILAMALAEQILQLAPGLQQGNVIGAAVCLLLPLNLAWIAWLGERGLFTSSGLLRIGVVLLQPVIIDILLRLDPQQVSSVLRTELLMPFFSALGVPQLAALAFLLATVLLALRFWFSPGVFEGALIWALAACGCGLQAGGGAQTTFFLATAGLILVVAVLETSYFMAYRDELTGLPSRRALNEYLLRTGSRYTVAMVDIDHFKKVNDTHGHDVGDQVLKMVASRLARVSGGGRAFRYGGEEFSVIFSGRQHRECLPHLEALRQSVAEAAFSLRAPDRPRKKPKKTAKKARKRRELKVTVSIGVAGRDAQNETSAEVIKAADQFLYRAKEAGRNRVCSQA